MRKKKQQVIKKIVESKGGLHASVYLKIGTGFHQANKELQSAIKKIETEVRESAGADLAYRFVSPLKDFLNGPNGLRNLTTSVAIFRSEDMFEVIKLPHLEDNDLSIADSFFVKPILRFNQSQVHYLLVAFSKERAMMYFGDSIESYLIDDVHFDAGFPEKNKELFLNEISFWINEWSHNLVIDRNNDFKIVILSDSPFAGGLRPKLKSRGEELLFIHKKFIPSKISSILEELRYELTMNAYVGHKKKVKEFFKLKSDEVLLDDFFEIASAIEENKVKRLMISDEDKIFGKFNRSNGKLSIHKYDLNCEDDDLLDDFAQEVIKSGGEVIVVKNFEANMNRPILAVIKKPPFKEMNMEASL